MTDTLAYKNVWTLKSQLKYLDIIAKYRNIYTEYICNLCYTLTNSTFPFKFTQLS